MKLFDFIKILNLKKISIFSVLLILFGIIPNCVLAEEENIQPSFGPEEDFDAMKSRMTESVDGMIETLENSTEDLDADTLESVEELINGLKSIKEELFEAETESDLQEIREEIDTLLEAAPEELKSIPGFGMGHSGPGQAQNGSQIPPQGPGNMSEGRPEKRVMNMSEKRPEIPEEANIMDENTSMEKQGIPGKAPGMQKEAVTEESSDKETSGASDFFGKLINSLKALFS